MAKFVENLSSFQAGVLSKKLYGRTDINEYKKGLSIGDNALIAKQGGAYKRFASTPIQQLGSNANIQVEAVTVFTNRTIFVVCDGTSISLLTERGHLFYGPDNLTGVIGEYSVVAYNDFIFATSYTGTDRPLAIKLSEHETTGNIIATPEDFGVGWASRPMANVNTDTTRTLKVNNVGQIDGADQIETVGWDIQEEFVIGDYVMITGRCRVVNGHRISTGIYHIDSFDGGDIRVAFVTAQWYYEDGLIEYDSLADLNDAAIGVYSVSGSVSKFFDEWSHSAWGINRGWPRMFAVDEGRLIAGAAKDHPSNFWGSHTNNPFFFLDRRTTNVEAFHTDGGVAFRKKLIAPYEGDIRETDPYNFTPSSKKGAEITFMESSTVFVVGTSRQEFIVTGDGSAISQKNISVRPHTSHGSMRNRALTFDNSVLFVGRNRRQIHLFKYNESNGSYITKEITVLNDDEFETDNIKSMEWHEELGIVFIVTESGRLATLTLGIDTDTIAFTFQDIGATVIDVAYGAEGDEDYMGIITSRNEHVYLEKLSKKTLNLTGGAGRSANYLDLGVEVANYLDAGAILDFVVFDSSGLGIAGSPRAVWIDNDMVIMDSSNLKVGDTIQFTSNLSDAQVWPSIGIVFNQNYWVIPYEVSGGSGVRFATSLANAQSGTNINLVGSGYLYIRNDAEFHYEITRDNSIIPIRQFPTGTVVKVFKRTGPAPQIIEHEFTSDGTDTYDLLANDPLFTNDSVTYGINYDFHIATMPIEAGQQWGSGQLGLVRVDKALIRTYETTSFKVSTDAYNSEEIFSSSKTGTITIPESERYEIALTGSNEFDQVIHIQNDKPEAVYIASLALRGVSNDG